MMGCVFLRLLSQELKLQLTWRLKQVELAMLIVASSLTQILEHMLWQCGWRPSIMHYNNEQNDSFVCGKPNCVDLQT